MDVSAVLRNSDSWWNQRVQKDSEEESEGTQAEKCYRLKLAVQLWEWGRQGGCALVPAGVTPDLFSWTNSGEVNLEENINKTWKETLGFRELPKGVSGKNHFSLCNLSLCFHRHLCGPNGVNFPKDQVFYSLLHLRSFLITFPAPGIITLCPSLNWPRYFLNSYINNTISQSNRKLSIFSGVVLFFGFL